MGNPYRSGASFPNLGPSIDNFTNNLVRLKMNQQDVDFRGRQLQQNANQFNVGAYGTPTPTQGMPTLAQQGMEASRREQSFREAEKPHLKNFGTVHAKTATNVLMSVGLKKDNPFIAEINELASNPDVANRDAYLHLKNIYPSYRENLRNEIGDNLVSKMEKDPMYMKTPEGKKQMAILDALDKDPTGEMILYGAFAPTVRAMQMEEAESAQTGQGVELWGPEQPGPGGTTRQISNRGSIRTVTKPEDPDRGFKKDITIADMRTNLMAGKDNPNYFEAYGSLYNASNKKNEVAYWDSESFDEEVKITKLPEDAIAIGWTPAKIQASAISKGETVLQTLTNLGIIEK